MAGNKSAAEGSQPECKQRPPFRAAAKRIVRAGEPRKLRERHVEITVLVHPQLLVYYPAQLIAGLFVHLSLPVSPPAALGRAQASSDERGSPRLWTAIK